MREKLGGYCRKSFQVDRLLFYFRKFQDSVLLQEASGLDILRERRPEGRISGCVFVSGQPRVACDDDDADVCRR